MRLPALLGNPRLKEAAQRMPQAPGAPIILEGPSGSGKQTAARDLAAALLCREADGPCGVCPACVRLKAGSHPDFYELAYEGKAVKVAEVRDLRARTFLKPQEAEFKVMLLHAADRLSPVCQNALLKVLEEPQGCAFILLCENREALLQTIRSRCIAYPMEPLSADTLAAALRERRAVGDLTAAMAASGGFLGRALAALSGETPAHEVAARDFALALTAGELEIYRAALAAEKLGRDGYPAFLDALCARLTEAVKKTGDKRYISVYEYIGQQQEMLVSNPSLAALTAALAAHCGAVMT